MGSGRLISVRAPTLNGNFALVGYFVAEEDTKRAVEIIRHKIARRAEEIVPVCRVSEELLNSLRVPPGGIMRVPRSDRPEGKY